MQAITQIKMHITQFSIEKEYEKHQLIKPDDIKLLREWLKGQPHLPMDITDLELILAYHSSERSSGVTKQMIDLNFTLRTKLPFFQQRDLNSVKLALHTWLLTPLPGKSVKGNRIFLTHMLDTDTNNFNHMDLARAFFMAIDLWQYEEGTIDGAAIVVNMDGVTWSHVTKTELIISRQFFYFVQEAMFLRIKEFHFLNAPTFIDKLYNIYSQFVKKELLAGIHIHGVGASLEKFVPKSVLPKELGGNYKDVFTLKDEVINKIKYNQQYFIEDSKKRVDETKRPASAKLPHNFEDIDGTFKKLEID